MYSWCTLPVLHLPGYTPVRHHPATARRCTVRRVPRAAVTRACVEVTVTDAGVTRAGGDRRSGGLFKAGKPGRAWEAQEVLPGTGTSSRHSREINAPLSLLLLLLRMTRMTYPGSLSSGVNSRVR